MTTEPKYYTIVQAAQRVGRTTRTIETWITEGLKVTRVTTGNKTTRYIELTDLQTTWRAKLLNNPTRATKRP